MTLTCPECFRQFSKTIFEGNVIRIECECGRTTEWSKDDSVADLGGWILTKSLNLDTQGTS